MTLETPAPKETRLLRWPRAFLKLRTNDSLAGIKSPVHHLAVTFLSLILHQAQLPFGQSEHVMVEVD